MRIIGILLITTISLSCLSACGGPGQDDDIVTRLDEIFDRLDRHQLFRGAALVSDGEQFVYTTARGLADEAWNIPNSVDTRYRIASLSKQFAAVVVLQLIDEGCLSLDDPLAGHLSVPPKSWAETVTVQHLLSQSSGIPDYTLLPDYLEVLSKRRFTLTEFVRFIFADPLFDTLRFTPSESWEYSNTNYLLLGALAEVATGESYGNLVKQRIFAPLAMRDSGVFDSLKPVAMLADGYDLSYTDEVERAAHSEYSPKSVPSGGLYSTVTDLLKWASALQEGPLLTPAMREIFTTPGQFVDESTGYACGQWREFHQTPNGERVEIFAHGGSSMGMSTWLLRVPTMERCVVLLHNGGSAREGFLEQLSFAILDVLDGGRGELPPLDLLGPLAGTYLNHRESLFDHYRLLKERHGKIYDFGPGQLSQIGRLLIARIGDEETAAALFRLNVEEHPDSPLAHRDLGGLLLDGGHSDRALVHLLQARELDPGPDAELDTLIARARE
ncbi:MAG: beta-lactamase family protein [bacterium]|nr:beta-lactamase family protein [bacterium]